MRTQGKLWLSWAVTEGEFAKKVQPHPAPVPLNEGMWRSWAF